ncbi:DNA recombination protein RmuC [Candidatus Thiothrix sp. Deng01]|uniref:DNA recombination protein RmuC n=1 Tax=Candidatus Thiothrix phosphatis TaxID=3112415 RepID=A0ABU6CZ54_9GAMM|nr:DNA recombination protein RmuC [Candidatus Thiothrix sp. Deng01]MEB4592111.1 DNA recombination protein RmuC [Candidatus Thiothrix sp. Deng01]
MGAAPFQLGALIDAHIVFFTAVTMFVLGLLAAHLVYNTPLRQARRELERLQLQLQTEEQLHEERLQTLDDAQDRLYNTFAALSQRALRENNTQFLQLAQETMGRFQVESRADLEQRQRSIQHLVDPIRDALAKTENQIREIEKERQTSFGVLSQQIRGMMNDQAALRDETGRLASALRTPGIRGQWGELSLRRIAELSGMVEHCDFIEQAQRSNAERTIRPDMVVRMPDEREMIVDAKAPMDAYLDAVSADNEDSRKRHLQRHARHVREHVRVLAGKRYWEQFEHSPDFVVLFIPGEQFLGAALEQDKTLLHDSLNDKVILATPSTLVALLRAVAFGWKQAVLAENAGKVRDLGEELHKRLTVFLDHLERLGRNLGSSVDTYNKALGSLERSVLPGARRLSELGISSGRNIAEPAPVETIPRRPYVKDTETDAETD